MNGKSWSMPFGMIFGNYHCAKCGAKLQKEKTHRVVSKDDKDYYQYHDHGSFPRLDYDVYDYRWRCPSCEARSSYEEQCILKRIQKRRGHFVLSSSEIKEHYHECKQENDKRVLYRSILTPIICNPIVFVLFYLFQNDKTAKGLAFVAVLFTVFTAFSVVSAIKRYHGSYGWRSRRAYSYEKEAQLKRLHTYSSHNKSQIAAANTCYCFYCKRRISKDDIKDYTDDGQTAICPACGVDAIIPDSIEEPLDDAVISEMNEYWF